MQPNYQPYLEYVTEHRNQYYRLAYAFMGNEADSMDAVSQLSVTVIEKVHTLRNQDAFPAWSKKILCNICRSRLKERKRREIAVEFPLSIAHDSSAEVNIEDKLLVREAIALLPEKYKEIIVLRYYLGYDYKEIAHTLDLPEGTVKSRLHRAVEQLRKEILGKEGLGA